MTDKNILSTLDFDFEPLEKILASLGVNQVFGEARTEGDVTIIPVSETGVLHLYGRGFGEGSSAKPDESETPPAEEGMGGGTGGFIRGGTKPRGFISVKDGQVSYEPMLNPLFPVIAGALLIAWIAFWVAATRIAVSRTKKLAAPDSDEKA